MSKLRRGAGYSLMVLVLLALVGSIVFRRDISDWLRLRSYTPPAEIVGLADHTTMFDDSRRLFYVTHPVVADKELFNEHCRDNEYTIVLGCYISGRQNIYLLDVDDERLNGVKEVTAAHELLHAAYERLSGKERERINTLLVDTYDKLEDTRIKETIELYRKQDPSIVPNELHSILGTELRALPAELEVYYKRYFSDRLTIVRYSEQYEQAFVERRNAVRDYDAQLTALKAQIDDLQAGLVQSDQQLKDQRDQMNSLKASNQIEAYNALVSPYNAKVNQYNRDYDRLSALVVQYNDIVRKRNAVASEEAELVEAIDSTKIAPDKH